jgi:SsrA-binding protein
MSLIINKKATFNYEILEKYTAGLELFGHEVKTLRGKQGSLEGSYIIIRGAEAFLINAHIPPYQEGNTPKTYDPYRARKLLLTKAEIETLLGNEKARGLSIIPLSIYEKGRFIKIDIAVGRGKKQHDKRETIKKREGDRTLSRIRKGQE